jgi:general secretion pathway protein G
LFELIVALLLVSVLIGVFLDRVLYYRELAEKSAMEQVAMDVRSSVNLRVAELALDNRFAELAALVGQNPMDLLARKPANYLGVLANAATQPAAPGNWYFDSTSKEVVYFIDLGRYFYTDEPGRQRVAWHITLVPGGAGKPGVPQWARFELVKPYHWFNKA